MEVIFFGGRYMKSTVFPMDLIAALPLDLVNFFVTLKPIWIFVLRAPKLLRLVHWSALFHEHR